jgi:ABC-type Zn uptake system ZnuABC Zn-binding protein ZnuA
MTAIVDKETLRHSLKQFAINEPDFVINLIKEIEADLENENDKKFEEILEKNFDEYAEVFKALA